jgi:hypothetical protein
MQLGSKSIILLFPMGIPVERQGRKAMGLKPAWGYDCQAARGQTESQQISAGLFMLYIFQSFLNIGLPIKRREGNDRAC